ncbi:MAG: LysR substrate-binding domain-containing protein [Polyangiales bacterium]
MTTDLRTEDLRLFVASLTLGSLSAAARAQGLTQAGASRRIQRLESALGAPVLHRTTRALRATVEGERLQVAARAMLAELDAFGHAAERARAAPVGEVHVSAPVLLGQAVGGALARALCERHPDLRLRLSLSNARVDLVRDGVDVAVRVGPLPDTSLLAARITAAEVGAYARRDRHARAKHPSELARAPWIGLPAEATLKAAGPEGQRWRGAVTQVFVCDDRAVLRDAAVAGVGAVLLPTFFGDAEPALRRVVPDWHFGRVPVHVVWLPEARDDARVRAVCEVMKAWGRAPTW